MTRETKIGLLTGLGVIVLIGVLLSEYLGGGAANASSTPAPAAMVDRGAAYRAAVMRPVGVPTDNKGGGGLASLEAVTGEPPVAFKTDSDGKLSPPGMVGPGGPVVMGAVSAEPAGKVEEAKPVVVDPLTGTKAGVAAVFVTPEQSKYLPVAGETTAKTPATLPAGEMYTIASGDSIQKIAKKFYKAAGKAEQERIVAANPTIRKPDGKILLIAGKKLLVPAAPVAVPVAVAPKKDPLVAGSMSMGPVGSSKKGFVVVAPGAGDVRKVDAKAGTRTEPKADARLVEPKVEATYTVASGDTLEKIAKKVLGSGSPANVAKIQALNGIKNPTQLKIGQVLKVPAKVSLGEAGRARG